MRYLHNPLCHGIGSLYRFAALLALSALGSVAWPQEATPNVVIQLNNETL
jgi:hypothetical protein